MRINIIKSLFGSSIRYPPAYRKGQKKSFARASQIAKAMKVRMLPCMGDDL